MGRFKGEKRRLRDAGVIARRFDVARRSAPERQRRPAGRAPGMARVTGGHERQHRRPHHRRLLARLRWYAREMSHPLLVLSTCPDAETAARIARALVEERLAACVSRIPGMASTYRWQDEIREDAEVWLLIKTTRDRFDALRGRLVELHPYEVPELLAIEVVDGHPAYLDWIATATAR